MERKVVEILQPFAWLALPVAAAILNMTLKIAIETSMRLVYFIARRTRDEWWLTLYLLQGAASGGVPAWLLQNPNDPSWLKTAAVLVGTLTGIVIMMDIMFSLVPVWMEIQRSMFILTSKGKVRGEKSHAA